MGTDQYESLMPWNRAFDDPVKLAIHCPNTPAMS
jgi:hypothetical protein